MLVERVVTQLLSWQDVTVMTVVEDSVLVRVDSLLLSFVVETIPEDVIVVAVSLPGSVVNSVLVGVSEIAAELLSVSTIGEVSEEDDGYSSLDEVADSVLSRLVGVRVMTVDVTNEQEWSSQDVMVTTVVESLYSVEEVSVVLPEDEKEETRVVVVLWTSRLCGT